MYRKITDRCDKCQAAPGSPCVSLGGYLPTGELPGDVKAKPHKIEKSI